MENFKDYITQNKEFLDFILSVTNILLVFVIAVVQIRIQRKQNLIQKEQAKLQEQQNKHQEYEQYKEIYICINSVHSALNEVISNVANNVFSIFQDSDNIKRLEYYKNEITTLKFNITENKIEINLKLGDSFEYDNYILALESAEDLYNIIIGYLKSDSIRNQINYIYYIKTEKENVECILNSVDETAKPRMEKIFNKFYECNTLIASSKALRFLEKRCKF